MVAVEAARRGRSASPEVTDTQADPVCGMSVDPSTAGTSVHAGETYWFCSGGCRRRFDADPMTFLPA